MDSRMAVKVQRIVSARASMRKVAWTRAAALIVLGAAALPLMGNQVWTSDILTRESSVPATKELKPISLVGARNGAFSGKVMVESVNAIKGVLASAGPLTGKGGAIIPAANVQIRYGKFWDRHGGDCQPPGADILLEAPAEAPAVRGVALLPVVPEV